MFHLIDPIYDLGELKVWRKGKGFYGVQLLTAMILLGIFWL